MKRVYKSPATPERLRSYVKAFPDETWEHFRRRNREVKQQLLRDQHGLCAYCEISIKLAEFEDNVDDFRVEHFFPKVATEFEKHNYHLDWHNLLGVCHGGSQPYVSDPEWRYSSRKNDRSCDVPKGGKPISERILNPLKIPASVRLFRYQEHTGKMIVDESSCPKKLQAKARNTIRELNLNAPRLQRMRLALIRMRSTVLWLAERCWRSFCRCWRKVSCCRMKMAIISRFFQWRAGIWVNLQRIF